MNRKTNYGVRWQDGSYDPYHDNYREIVTKKSYWNWVEENAPQDEDGVYIESAIANPDSLMATRFVEPVLTEDQDEIRQAAFNQLTPRQKEVWDLVMRQGFTEEEASSKLNVERVTVQTHLNRAKTSFTNFVREAEQHG